MDNITIQLTPKQAEEMYEHYQHLYREAVSCRLDSGNLARQMKYSNIMRVINDAQLKAKLSLEKPEKILWVCGKWIVGKDPIWELQGVFDNEQTAFDYARPFKNYFIGPATLNKPFPHESGLKWEGSYYPYYKEVENGRTAENS